LLVEDVEAVRRLISYYLASSGYRVLEAENGEDAFRVTNEHGGPIDLLITEVRMPKANGFQVARALAERLAGLKIIFISGYVQDLDGERERQTSAVRFLLKPFLKEALLNMVSDLLGQEKERAAGSFA
jgi:CheY-like chemotaxis protein